MTLHNENRENEILHLLLTCSDYLTIEKIAGELGVSKRTIQNDIDKLMQHISEMGLQSSIEVEKKSGSGIKIRSIGNCISLLGLNGSSSFRPDSDQWSQDRRTEILNMLLNSDSELDNAVFAPVLYEQERHRQGLILDRGLALQLQPGDSGKARHKGILVTGSEMLGVTPSCSC